MRAEEPPAGQFGDPPPGPEDEKELLTPESGIPVGFLIRALSLPDEGVAMEGPFVQSAMTRPDARVVTAFNLTFQSAQRDGGLWVFGFEGRIYHASKELLEKTIKDMRKGMPPKDAAS